MGIIKMIKNKIYKVTREWDVLAKNNTDALNEANKGKHNFVEVKLIQEFNSKFKIGDKVRVKKDASNVYKEYLNENGYKANLLINGLDQSRKLLLGKTGVIVDIRFCKSEPDDDVQWEAIDYTIKFSPKNIISMVEEWLEKK